MKKTASMLVIAAVLALVSLVLLTGCSGPHHTVIDTPGMVVYHAEKRDNIKLGKYEYWVRDGSTQGWVLISDQEFKVGDKLVITTTR
jgi:accessory colonization factor AcfC